MSNENDETDENDETPETHETIARNYVRNEVYNLRTLREQVDAAVYNYEASLRQLSYYLKQNPELFEERPRYSLEAEIRGNKTVAFDDFTIYGDDVPFFSEIKLYDLLGKDSAREVLGFIENMKKHLK